MLGNKFGPLLVHIEGAIEASVTLSGACPSKEAQPMKKFTRSVLPGLLIFGLVMSVQSAWAAAGSLDPTFGRGGVTVTNFASQSDVIPYSGCQQQPCEILR